MLRKSLVPVLYHGVPETYPCARRKLQRLSVFGESGSMSWMLLYSFSCPPHDDGKSSVSRPAALPLNESSTSSAEASSGVVNGRTVIARAFAALGGTAPRDGPDPTPVIISSRARISFCRLGILIWDCIFMVMVHESATV